ETEIYRLTVQFLDLSGAAVLSLAQFAIVGAALAVSAWLRRRGERATHIVREDEHGSRPTLQDAPAIAVFVVMLVLLHALPIATLVARSLRGPDGSWSFANYVALVVPPAESPLHG